MQLQPSVRRALLLGVFVASGFTGLIYESIWSHYLKLFLGHAAYAQTVVLTIFMAGMALGSWLAAQWSPRIHRLLLAYAAVEAAVGGIGLVFHPAFVRAMDWSYASIFPALSSDAALHAFKWTLAGLSVLPQSILLGMTFPLMSAGLVRQCPQRPGETLALLYFANSLGAALGVLVSGFVLIRLVGLPGTMMTAALVNIVLACLVFLTVRGEPQPVVSAVPSHAPDTRAHRWFLGTAFLTGAASFMYEIGWIRMLSLVLGSSTHSFELMLSAFIFGLAFGGLWIRRRIESIKNPLSHVGYVMVVMGALALMTLPSYNWMFDFMAWALQTLATTEGGYAAFNASSQSIALMVMLPTTFCAGMTLPLLTHAFLQRAGSERAIGRLYAANTAGAIVGVLAGVHVLMPLAGTKGLIVTGAGIHMALGLSGLVASGGVRLTVRYRVAAGCAAALVAVGLFVNLDVLRMSSGVFRTGLAVQGGGTKVLYFQDGKTSTVSLLEQGGSIAIATNGKPDAAMNMGVGPPSTDEITMVLLGALPVGLHPHPERVANIGFGAGLTSHVVLGSDRVKHLDTIEIEPRMVEAARLAYFPRIRRALEDSRSKIVFDDAKTFFATARVPYDIIISEPSNPWVSGVATLFSDEFYARVTRYLRPDGYLVQWLQLYETDMTVVASVLKALRKHFPTYAIYSTDDTNVMIIAARSSEIPWNPVHMFDDPAVATELARVGVTSVG
ncbi:MAG TPA: fused MFS/spermidine synthase, partial [Polyangiaceae bacterium]|nr:fused MFS/spermidine synthase [Polyangiaceae bacterium]